MAMNRMECWAIRHILLLAMLFAMPVAGVAQEASDELIEYVDDINSLCPRMVFTGTKLASVEIDDEYVNLTLRIDQQMLRGGINELSSDKFKEDITNAMLKFFRRTDRNSVMRKMAEEVANCGLGINAIINDLDGNNGTTITITNEQLSESLGR